jgi:hypothetical protein
LGSQPSHPSVQKYNLKLAVVRDLYAQGPHRNRSGKSRGMPDIEFVRGEIERMRLQVRRRRREIIQLQRAGIGPKAEVDLSDTSGRNL